MKFTKIAIEVPDMTAGELEIFTSRLDDLGAEGFEFSGFDGGGNNEDDAFAWFTAPEVEPDLALAPSPQTPTVTMYISQNEQGGVTVRKIRRFAESQRLVYNESEVCEEDWENNWKEYFKAFSLGERLVIKPSWEELESEPDWQKWQNENRLILQIDPASAFGTGQHASTRMCLQLLERLINSGDTVLDMGCGSGILSAGAVLLGAAHATAVDICENSVRVTNDTLLQNGIDQTRATTYCGNIITDEELRSKLASRGKYDLVVANITADVIVAMASHFPLFVNERLLLSGIISHRLPEVKAALEGAFTIVETFSCEDWLALQLAR
ncbi:MAG: 50S ribosomal protein L11 methyltransferase [Oscillospiraceae bacterium]|nr:50S ribosomal protein L11 methyltransferase [Oscillospiraceae bacterium]